MATIDFQLFNLIRIQNLNLDFYDSGGGAAWTANPPAAVTGAVTGSCQANVPNDSFVSADYFVGDRKDVFLHFRCGLVNNEPKVSTFSSSIDYKVESNYRDEGNGTFVVNIDYRPAAG